MVHLALNDEMDKVMDSLEPVVEDFRAYFPVQAGIQRYLPINDGRLLGSAFHWSDEYTGTGPIDAFDTDS